MRRVHGLAVKALGEANVYELDEHLIEARREAVEVFDTSAWDEPENPTMRRSSASVGMQSDNKRPVLPEDPKSAHVLVRGKMPSYRPRFVGGTHPWGDRMYAMSLGDRDVQLAGRRPRMIIRHGDVHQELSHDRWNEAGMSDFKP
jgi:hypothetical protein